MSCILLAQKQGDMDFCFEQRWLSIGGDGKSQSCCFSANPPGAAEMPLRFVKTFVRNTIARFRPFLPQNHFGFAQNA